MNIGSKDVLQAKALAAPVILVIDDDTDILDSLTCCLASAGYRVITEPSAKAGLARASSEAPDAILVDLLMPEKDGIETILQIRRERPDARIIAMSGGGQIDGTHYLEIAVKLGANMALEKPIDVCKLLTGLKALIHPLPAISAARAERPFRRWADVRAQEALGTAGRCLNAKIAH